MQILSLLVCGVNKEGKQGGRPALLSHGSATPSCDQGCVYSSKEHKRGTGPHVLITEEIRLSCPETFPAWCGNPLGYAGTCLAHVLLSSLGVSL